MHEIYRQLPIDKPIVYGHDNWIIAFFNESYYNSLSKHNNRKDYRTNKDHKQEIPHAAKNYIQIRVA